MTRCVLALVVLVIAAVGVSGRGAQQSGGAMTDVPPAIRSEAQRAFRQGMMCFIWPGTSLVVKNTAGALAIGPFFSLADRSLQFRIWTTVPGSIEIDSRILSASPGDAGQFEVRLNPKVLARKTQITIKLSGYGSPSDVWAGKDISNAIELTVDPEKMEATVLKPQK